MYHSFFFIIPAPTELYPLSLHDALPILGLPPPAAIRVALRSTAVSSHVPTRDATQRRRSEEHTSELQSRFDLVCRLLLEKKKNQYITFRLHAHKTFVTHFFIVYVHLSCY